MSFTERDGHAIYFEVIAPRETPPSETGPGAAGGLPLVLSHGFGASSAMWAPNAGPLAAGRPVITWDMRGHGRSGGPLDPAQYSAAETVADLAAVLDAAGAERAVVGGLSLGGYMSLEFWIAHPGRVAGLILCDTGPGYRNDHARQQWNDRALATAARLERDGLAAVSRSRETSDAGHSSAQALAHAARGMLTQHDPRVIEALPAIDVPVLVIVGADDEPFLGAASYLAARIPGAVHAVLPAAGHASNLDQPALFNETVQRFLEQPGVAA